MLREILNDTSGNLSAARVGFLIVVAAFIGTWSYLSITKKELQPIDVDQLILILGAFGFKVYQRSVEQ